jgi:glycerophosphoryl diester phosphodiesterase
MATHDRPLTLPDWPYPRWIAHRGAGTLAPENTLAAFRLGHTHGYRMFECDVKLSSDGVPFLLHDDTLARTCPDALGLQPIAGHNAWSDLAQQDAGSWHSTTYFGEPLPSLENISRFCIANGCCLNIEIKPTTGTGLQTGKVVAQHAARLWQKAPVAPLLSSFEVDALEGAMAQAPALPRALLLHTLWDGWLETALRLQCIAIVCNYTLWNKASVSQAKAAGLRTLSYTVNDSASVTVLIDLETDGIITDRVDLFNPHAI